MLWTAIENTLKKCSKCAYKGIDLTSTGYNILPTQLIVLSPHEWPNNPCQSHKQRVHNAKAPLGGWSKHVTQQKRTFKIIPDSILVSNHAVQDPSRHFSGRRRLLYQLVNRFVRTFYALGKLRLVLLLFDEGRSHEVRWKSAVDFVAHGGSVIAEDLLTESVCYPADRAFRGYI